MGNREIKGTHYQLCFHFRGPYWNSPPQFLPTISLADSKVQEKLDNATEYFHQDESGIWLGRNMWRHLAGLAATGGSF